MLTEVFGYDRYSEITREYAIRSTYCDLAIQIDGKLTLLIEVKAIGVKLSDKHIKQAVDYAQNAGLDWVVLTNGLDWKVYHLVYGKPVEAIEIISFSISDLNPRNSDTADTLFLLSSEGFSKNVLDEYRDQRKAMSRYTIASLLQSEDVAKILRREIRKMSPNVKVDLPELQDVIVREVLKRDVTEGEEAEDAQKRISKALKKSSRKKASPSATKAPMDPTSAQPHEKQAITQE